MIETIPGLLVALPIIAAAVPLFVTLIDTRIGWSLSAVVLTVETALAGWLAYTVYSGPERVSHILGGDAFGRVADEGYMVGIELVADPLSTVLILLIAVVGLLVLAFSRQAGPRGNVFYSGYLLLTGGLMGVAMTGDLFNLFVFLEITGLATYALVASNYRGPAAAVAALKYLIIGTIGASLYLVGVGFIYVQTGTLNMVDVQRSLAGSPEWINTLYGEPLTIAAFGFIAVGLLIKAAIFPLHTWQPDAYQRAPDAVTIFIAALVSTSAAYAFGRITLNVFTPAFFEVGQAELVLNGILALTGASIVAGSALAAVQRSVKRMFAYSSVAQFGLIILGFGLAVHPAGGPEAAEYAIYGAVIHLLAHAILKGGLFATAGALAVGENARTVTEYAGLAKRRPFLSGSLAVLGVGLVGIPPTIGFVGKWYLVIGSIETRLWPLVFVILASTLLTLLYVTRLLEKLYFDYLPDIAPDHAEPSQSAVAMATDGGTDGPVSLGMYGIVVGAAILSFFAGFGGAEMAGLLEPLVEAVQENDPVVGTDLSEVIDND